MVNPVAFSILGKDIYWYGIIIASAVLIGAYLSMREAKRLNYNPELILDFVLLALPLAIIGARTYYVIFSWQNYAGDWKSIIAIWEGGLAVYGGIIGGTIAALIFCKWKKVHFADLADMIAPSLILGQAIGRWGNFFNQEAYGRGIINKVWQWFPAAVYIEADQKWHMATFFYESSWDFLTFLFLMYYRKRRKVRGNVFLAYLILYSIGRIVIEGLRTDSLMLGPLRVSQWLSGILIISASILILKRSKTKSDELKYN